MASEKNTCSYTAQELAAYAKHRRFDQVIVVTRKIQEKVKNITDIYGLEKWTEQPAYSPAYQGMCASAWMDDVELKLIQPDYTASIWETFAGKYGDGICCVREVIPRENWESEKARLEKLGLAVCHSFTDETGETIVYDLLDTFGGCLAIHLDSADRRLPKPEQRNRRKLIQINVTTDDADRTIEQLTRILRIGPWSIGTLNNQTVTNPGLLVDNVWCEPKFSFQLGITLAGNMEFEVIQPVTGPTVYQTYLDRRGMGYHHIKEIIPPEKLQEAFDGYKAKGMPLCIKGTMDITTFGYIDSEEALGFYVEMGDGLPPNALPEGYNEYWYPSKEK